MPLNTPQRGVFAQTVLGRLDALESQVSSEKFDVEKHKHTTRSKITLLFLVGLFLLVVIGYTYAIIQNCLILSALKNPDIDVAEYKDLLVKIDDVLYPISSLLGASLGFVIGYYFKGEK